MSALALQTGSLLAPTRIVTVLGLLSLLLGLGITAAAVQGYLRNRSLPMLFLALGIASLTFLRTVATAVTGQFGTTAYVGVVHQLFAFLGLCAIAFSLVLLKRG